MKNFIAFASLLSLTTSTIADSCNQPYSQCNGQNWNTVTCCTNGYFCKKVNQWWSQCLPVSEEASLNNENNSNSEEIPINNEDDRNFIYETIKTKSIKKTSKAKSKKTKSIITTKAKFIKTTKTKLATESKSTKNTKTKTAKTTTTIYQETESPQVNKKNECKFEIFKVDGFAAMNGGTHGGMSIGLNYKVYRPKDFNSLKNYLKGNEQKLIIIDSSITLYRQKIDVGSHTTILGVNNNSTLSNGVLKLVNTKDVIIKNIRFNYCYSPPYSNCIYAENATNIAIDHCEFYNDKKKSENFYKSIFYFIRGSDYITLSWNYIHDQFSGAIFGHRDNYDEYDSGKLHVTLHNNYFKDVSYDIPTVRFGFIHVYNNAFENIDGSGVHLGKNSTGYIEHNIYRGCVRAIITERNRLKYNGGSVRAFKNSFGFCRSCNDYFQDFTIKVPYEYEVENEDASFRRNVKEAGLQRRTRCHNYDILECKS